MVFYFKVLLLHWTKKKKKKTRIDYMLAFKVPKDMNRFHVNFRVQHVLLTINLIMYLFLPYSFFISYIYCVAVLNIIPHHAYIPLQDFEVDTAKLIWLRNSHDHGYKANWTQKVVASCDNMCTSNDFDCYICCEVRIEPVITPCGHLFFLALSLQLATQFTRIKEKNLVPVFGKGRSKSSSSEYSNYSNIPNRPSAKQTRATSSRRVLYSYWCYHVHTLYFKVFYLSISTMIPC